MGLKPVLDFSDEEAAAVTPAACRGARHCAPRPSVRSPMTAPSS